MKKFLDQKPFLFPGYGQLAYGKKVRGWILTLTFWDCVLIGALFILFIKNSLAFPIGLLCEILAGLLWVYSYLDYLDLEATLPKPEKFELSSMDLLEEPKNKKDPEEESSFDHYESGRIYYLNGELKAARKDFEKALAANEEDWDAMYQLGRVHFDLGNKRKAKKYFADYRKTKDSTKWNKETDLYLKQIEKN